MDKDLEQGITGDQDVAGETSTRDSWGAPPLPESASGNGAAPGNGAADDAGPAHGSSSGWSGTRQWPAAPPPSGSPTLGAPTQPQPERRPKPSWGLPKGFVGRRLWVVLAVLFGLLVLVLGGVAFATYSYSNQYEGRILPGATIGGVDVGGMTPAGALGEVKRSLRPEMTRRISVRWKNESWNVTPKELGAKSDARAAVDAAVEASGEASMLDKAGMRFFGKDLGFERGIAFRYPKQGPSRYIDKIAAGFDREARDAAIDTSSGWVEIVSERAGRKVVTDASRRNLMGALHDGSSSSKLVVDKIEPEVTTAAFDQVLLLRQSEHKLYLYQDGEITNSYTVAVGQPAYPTPTGTYEVIDKVAMPTWTNPDPTGWGAGMPATIPAGPSNPLGVRALYWNASGIRFHGTDDIGSLGSSVSHGCVRLSNAEVTELYDLVDVGTPIASVS